MKNDCFGIQNDEKQDFVHKRHSVTGELRLPDPLAEFQTFFFIFQKNYFLVKKHTFWL